MSPRRTRSPRRPARSSRMAPSRTTPALGTPARPPPSARRSLDRARVGELSTQVAQERLDRQLLARDAGQQLGRRQLAPVHVDLLPQPRPQRAEVAALDLLVDVRKRAAQRLPQLRRLEVAERVG